jgi:CHAD domain-containing protein
LRRLRSALSLFKDLVADDEIGKLKSGLRRIWQRLGDARDLDVVLVDLRGAGEAPAANEPGKAEFIARMQADREQAYDRVTAALQDVRFRRLLLDLLAWSETGPWLTADDPDRQARRSEPLDSFAAGVLARQRRKVRRRGQHLGELDVADRHRVRIEAKKLRYATEFFSTLAATKKARRRHETFLKSLEDLQEHLGRLNDLATGEQMAQQQPEDLAARSTEAMPADGREPAPPDNRDVETSLAAATDAFRDFANAKRFWQEPDAPGKERHTSRE